MATDTQPQPVQTVPGTYRPIRADFSVAPMLRRLTGVREDILDWVPEERARYTMLGVVIVNTGLLAAASLLVALTNVASVAWPLLLPFALMWGFIIICFDSSIVASTHGAYGGKWRVYIWRLLVSILISAFIAEPLVLWFFRTAISAEVGHQRAAAVSSYEGRWVRCNPVSGARPPGCSNYLLNLSDSPTTVAQELANQKQLLSSVQAQIGTIDAAVANLRYQARAECDGVRLPGGQTTGLVGQGQNCQQDRADYTQYGQQHGLPGLLASQGQYQSKVAALTQKLAESQSGYGAAVQKAISQQVALWEQGTGKPGLLDEESALQALSSQSSFVLSQQWLLRLLLIALDTLPLLTKWFGRTTEYDKLCTRQLEAGNRLHDKRLSVHEHKDTSVLDLQAKETEYAYRDGLADMAQRDRVGHGQREMDEQKAIADLAAQLRAARR
jgi:hypothetical protein